MIAGWLIIGVIIVVGAMAIFRSQDLIYFINLSGRYFFFFVTIALVLFLVFSIYRVSTASDLHFTSFDGIMNAGKVYFGWFKGILSNIANVGGYVVKQDWTNVSIGSG